MKSLAFIFVSLALASAVAATPFEGRIMTSDRGLKQEDAVEIIDSGMGDTAAVIVARRSAFEPFAPAVLTTSPARPRVIAFLLNGQSLEELGGADGLYDPIMATLERKGIRSACLVSCGDCVPVALRLAESLEPVSSLVLMASLPEATVPITKAVYFASDGQASLLGLIESALRIVELEPPKPLFRRVTGFVPR